MQPQPKQRQQLKSAMTQPMVKLQKPPRLRTNTRLCRETAITNSNSNSSLNMNNDQNNNCKEDFNILESDITRQGMDEDHINGNVLHLHVNETAQILMEGEDLEPIQRSTSESIAQNAAQNNTQSKKIRITENPLPETVSC